MTITNWKNTLNDELPSDKQDLIVSVDGVYYMAVYDAAGQRFTLKYEIGAFFSVENTSIYWKELTPP